MGTKWAQFQRSPNGRIARQGIMDISGHVGAQMFRRYSRIQLEAKPTAIQGLSNCQHTIAAEGADVT